ncbi:MAG: phosphotransferase [Actinomycetota bacterium]|nr:phosphotransferase [Actinomycetota bacterium]
MRERPDGLSDNQLMRGLADGWGLQARELTFLPVGAGGYHWAVDDADGERWFVTVDVTADPERLSQALGTAMALDLPFVLAPAPARDGTAIRRLTPRHTLAVYPLVDGVAGDFGPHPPAERERVLDLLIALHQAAPAVPPPRTDLRLPGRLALEEALDDLAGPWGGGPYSERARRELASHAGRVRGWLADFDRLAGSAGDPAAWAVTHGEPHPGNVLRAPSRPPSGGRTPHNQPIGPADEPGSTGHSDAFRKSEATGGTRAWDEPDRLWLIDWDTVMVAPAERDLWMLTGSMIGATGDDPALLKRYEQQTGRAVSPELIAFYRLWWVLADVAVYVDELRRPHGENADLAASLTYLTGNLRE